VSTSVITGAEKHFTLSAPDRPEKNAVFASLTPTSTARGAPSRPAIVWIK
jgi:hypothetical protein